VIICVADSFELDTTGPPELDEGNLAGLVLTEVEDLTVADVSAAAEAVLAEVEVPEAAGDPEI